MTGSTISRKAKTITTPAFTMRGLVDVTVPEKIVKLEGDGGDYQVFIQARPGLFNRIGRISKDGTGWTAFAGDDTHVNGMPTFTGDHFPTRTGKHTRTYAVCYLIALAAGFSSTRATYELSYDGVAA